MKPDRGLRIGSVSSGLAGVSTMRSPSGSIPASAPVSGILRPPPPPTKWPLGTMSASTTFIQGVHFIEEKYSAAAFISSGERPFAMSIIWPVLRFLLSLLVLAPLLKSSSCCRMYSAGRPAGAALLGGALQVGEWENAQAF